MTSFPAFTYKSAYRQSLLRLRNPLSWEDRLDTLAHAARNRRHHLASVGMTTLRADDYAMPLVCASAHRADVRRVLG